MIYFDNSATSPIDEEVLDAMLPYLREEYGNPSSKYYCKAVTAKRAVDSARNSVAQLLGADPEEIIFTAGSTESTNFIIKGYMDYRRYYGDGKNHVITSKVEHKATLNTCKFLAGELYSNDDPTISLLGDRKKVNRGYEASFVDVSSSGEILADNVSGEIRENTALVSVLYVNNEIGTVSDIKSIARICHEKSIAIHADLTQAIGKMMVDVNDLGIDFASCSAHKIYGPKGIGAAYLKSDLYGIPPISSFMHGGEQEQGLRAGTLSVHNIVGFGKAAEISLKNQESTQKRIKLLDKYAVNKLLILPDVHLTNPMSNRVPGILSIIIDKTDFHNERFIKQISDEVALSTGSACSAGEPSYVISALGLENKVTKILRITLNKFSCEEDINHLVEIIKKYS